MFDKYLLTAAVPPPALIGVSLCAYVPMCCIVSSQAARAFATHRLDHVVCSRCCCTAAAAQILCVVSWALARWLHHYTAMDTVKLCLSILSITSHARDWCSMHVDSTLCHVKLPGPLLETFPIYPSVNMQSHLPQRQHANSSLSALWFCISWTGVLCFEDCVDCSCYNSV